MKSDAYSAPVIEELAAAAEPVVVQKEEVKQTVPVAETVDPTSNEQFWRTEVDKYFLYLAGKRGYKTTADRIRDNIAFMQRTGTMVAYSYPEFEDCFLYLIKTLRDNPDLFADGRFFRFIEGTEVTYPHTALNSYRNLMSWVIKIAKSWPTRVNLARGTDIETLSVHLRKEAKDNLNLFVRKMANFGL